MTKVICIAWRPGISKPAGEWNLINQRNLALKQSFNIDVHQIIISRHGLWSTVPTHLKEDRYAITFQYYNLPLIGEIAACFKAYLCAKNLRPNAVILSGGLTGLIARLLCVDRIPTIADIHGDWEAEYNENSDNTKNPYYYWRSRISSAMFNWASAYLVVSNELGMQARQKTKGRKPIFVAPCACNKHLEEAEYLRLRRETRRHYKYTDQDVVLVHSGGVSASWQCFQEYLVGFATLGKMHKHLKLLCLTPEGAAAEKMISANVPEGELRNRITIAQSPPEQILTHLCGCDIGLLLRHRNLTNKVAFPNKIDEYLASGLFILTSIGLPAAVEIIEKHPECGTILNSTDLADAEMAIRSTDTSESATLRRWRATQVQRSKHSFITCLAPLVAWLGASEK